ncbi:MAG: UDP-glucose 4-epimerase GalE [Rickettsiales bacterium]|nr:UDP-glucose 4-epimerase GalE [Rickettsiales bacterium]
MTDSILVAGGAGYIGSHVCKALKAEGFQPVTLDNFSAGRRDFVKFGPLVEASVDDTASVTAAVKQYGIRAVIDLAGSIEVAESVRDPLKYYENNFAVKIPFLRALADAGVQAVVFSSTAAVYGEPVAVPIKESHPLLPKNPYGQSKLAYEHLLRDFHAAGGPKWMALRYFNAAGASLDGDLGECHEPESHLIPLACMAQLGMGPALSIFGNDYPTPDKTAVRDYIHVMDLAAAHVLAVKALLSGSESGAYNLGNGIGTSIGQVIAAFERLGLPVPHSFKPRRAGDPSQLVADSSAAKAALGWMPRYADIDTIIRSAHQWHQSTLSKAKASAS